MKNNKIGICIPTYNEKKNIISLIKELIKINQILICVVDDSSPDKTYEEVKKKFKSKINKKIILIKRKRKNGRGSAVWDGFKQLYKKKVSLFIEMDSDFSHSLKDLKRGIKIFKKKQKKIDILLGSRYPKGLIVNWPIQRRIFSKLANFLARLLISKKINDYTNGFRFYSKSAACLILKKKPENKGYIYLMESLSIFISKKMVIDEFIITFKNRIRGKSNTNLNEIINSLIGIFKIAFKFHKKNFKIKY